jgi:hypothetical protein
VLRAEIWTEAPAVVFVRSLERGKQVIDSDCSVAEDAAKRAKGNFAVKRNGDRLALRVS